VTQSSDVVLRQKFGRGCKQKIKRLDKYLSYLNSTIYGKYGRTTYLKRNDSVRPRRSREDENDEQGAS
jgi:hypothetical protein